MRFDVLTLFPPMFEAVLGDSIIGRARKKGILNLNFWQIRDFSTDKHRCTDDYPYSGGPGMLMMAQPIYDAYRHVTQGLSYKPLTIYMSPQGKVFNQKMAVSLSRQEHIVVLCGHYEGVDQRALDEIVDMEVSVGDFVLTGGEIPAMAVADCLCRMVPGVLPDEECFTEESHWNGLLEYPQYSRPDEWHGRRVPDVLLSGHHGNVEKWRRKQSYIRTMLRRPDLWAQFDESVCKTKGERKLLAEAKAEAEALRTGAEPSPADDQ